MNFSYRNNIQKGFVALVTALMISAMLLIVACTLSFSAYNSRFNRLSDEFKEESYQVARACVDQTILRLGKQSGYHGNATTTVSGSECHVGNIERSGDNATFIATAYAHDTYTNIKITMSVATLAIISREELPKHY